MNSTNMFSYITYVFLDEITELKNAIRFQDPRCKLIKDSGTDAQKTRYRYYPWHFMVL